MDAIKILNFTKKYGDFVAVKNMNLFIKKGEITGFVGKNGAGKSTTIRSIVNCIFPSDGEILVGGKDSAKNAKEIKKTLSYIPSDAFFHENSTANDIFKLCNKFSSSEKTEELIDYFELNANKKIAELSLGNRKKVSIITAFLKESDIFIMDEPTNGLDPLMQEKFFNLVLAEKEKGNTIFLSSHNLSEIEKYCDRVIFIKDGEIIDDLAMKNISKSKVQKVSYSTKTGENESFDFTGDVNEFIAKLSTLDLKYVEISSPSIENQFKKYYVEGEKDV